MAFTVATNWSTSVASTSMSNTSMSAKTLNSTPFPSITGLLASGPMSPNPRTAVPLLITATKLPLAVYVYTSWGFSEMAMQGSATPGL